MLSQREIQRQRKIAQTQVVRADERNRIRDSRRQSAIMDAWVTDAFCSFLRMVFIPCSVNGKRALITFIVSLLLGPFGIGFYFASFGSFIRWFIVILTTYILLNIILGEVPRWMYWALAWFGTASFAALRVKLANLD